MSICVELCQIMRTLIIEYRRLELYNFPIRYERRKHMPRTDFVERTIFNVEGFTVNFIQNGKNLRGDVQQPHNYIANRATWNSFTVAQLIDKMKTQFPGYDFEVLKGDGTQARGNMSLANLRDTY